jgi:hypothetical protein|tara:strand:- start:5241 stop:5459 length:219 start_codon:yes stop_codon:yes gene_type:complete
MPESLVKPNIPPDSCDHIDRVMELSDKLVDEEDTEIRTGYGNIIKEEVELMRTINTQLRIASKFWYDRHKKK